MRQVDDAIDRWTSSAGVGERFYVVIERRARGWAWHSAVITPELAKDQVARRVMVDEMLEDGLVEIRE